MYSLVFTCLVEAIKNKTKTMHLWGFCLFFFFLSSVLRKGLIFLFISMEKGSGQTWDREVSRISPSG